MMNSIFLGISADPFFTIEVTVYSIGDEAQRLFYIA